MNEQIAMSDIIDFCKWLLPNIKKYPQLKHSDGIMQIKSAQTENEIKLGLNKLLEDIGEDQFKTLVSDYTDYLQQNIKVNENGGKIDYLVKRFDSGGPVLRRDEESDSILAKVKQLRENAARRGTVTTSTSSTSSSDSGYGQKTYTPKPKPLIKFDKYGRPETSNNTKPFTSKNKGIVKFDDHMRPITYNQSTLSTRPLIKFDDNMRPINLKSDKITISSNPHITKLREVKISPINLETVSDGISLFKTFDSAYQESLLNKGNYMPRENGTSYLDYKNKLGPVMYSSVSQDDNRRVTTQFVKPSSTSSNAWGRRITEQEDDEGNIISSDTTNIFKLR